MTCRNPYIVDRLDAWAERKAREADGGVGAVSISSIYSGRERVACAAHPGTNTLGDPEAEEMDALVVRLYQVDPKLGRAVIQVHLHGRRWTLAFNARRLQVSPACLRLRLARADLFLDAWLREKREPAGVRRNLASIRLQA